MNNSITLPPIPPLDDALLAKYNFFELCPLDGGGFFIQRELFGTLDDAEIARKLVAEDALADFGSIDKIDFKRYERWRSIEKSCWINRCYFIVPLAKTAWLTHDEKLAKMAAGVMLNFHRTCPPPDDLQAHWERVKKRMTEDYNSKSPSEIEKDETDVEYIWYDMQPGQRLLMFLYACYFIWESPAITAAERAELLDCLRRHARVLADQERFQQPYLNNHQAIRALALYCALPLLEKDADYQDAAATAHDICAYHALNEFLPSGMELEYSPSYHSFVLWIVRDFKRLATRRGVRLSNEIEARIAAACTALQIFQRPDGKVLTLNDSYQFELTGLLASLGNDAAELSQGVCSGLAAAKNGACYTAMDATAFIGKFSHFHGGKNSPAVFFHGLPFIEETGCPSYDNPNFANAKLASWHSSLLVDGAGDSHQFGLYGFDGWPTLEHDENWKCDEQGRLRFCGLERSNVPAWEGVEWRRETILAADEVVFKDEITSANQKHTFTLLFNIAPGVSVRAEEDGWRLERGGVAVKLSVECNGPSRQQFNVIQNCLGKTPQNALQLAIIAESAGLAVKTALKLLS